MPYTPLISEVPTMSHDDRLTTPTDTEEPISSPRPSTYEPPPRHASDETCSLESLGQARYRAHPPVGSIELPADERESWDKLYSRRRQRYEERFGTILREYWCKNIAAAAVLTDQNHYDCSLGSNVSVEIESLLDECDSLHLEVHDLLNLPLHEKDRSNALRSIMNVASTLLATLDAPNARDDTEDTARLTSLREELRRVRSRYVRTAQRTAQLFYFRGMLIGVAFVAALAVAVSVIISLSSAATSTESLLAATFVSGGAGAFVSVMTRMGSGRMVLDYSVGWTQVRTLGLFRPVIGGLLGSALYVLIAGNVLSVFAKPTSDDSFFFYSGIGFLAGFSERWAQDMLSLGRVGSGTSRKSRSQKRD